MKKLLVPLISVILNAYFVLAWVYIYNTFETHQERVNVFLRFIPKGVSVGWVSSLLILLSVVSVILTAKSNIKPGIKGLFLIVQSGFALLLVWQWL